MITTINSNERVFQVVDSWGRGVFCNISELGSVVNEINDDVTIYHFWNSKREKASKSLLKDMFEASEIIKNF
jgi:hypothetical protein